MTAIGVLHPHVRAGVDGEAGCRGRPATKPAAAVPDAP
jgi:hypothetical protein